MKKALSGLIAIAFQINFVFAEDNSLFLSLTEAEKLALNFSFQTKIAESSYTSAANKADAQRSFMYPKLSLEGSYKYVSEIPSLSFPGGAKMAFGGNDNYSVGPVLTWTLWDFGNIRNSVKSLDALVSSKDAEKKFSIRQAILKTRIAYFKVQLKSEQFKMISDSLQLAESQHKDIKNRLSAGSSNRIDLLSAHKEVLDLTIQAKQVQSDLNNEIRDLLTLIGKDPLLNTGKEIKLDPIKTSLSSLGRFGSIVPTREIIEHHPLVKMHADNAESARRLAESLKSNKLPKISLMAKTSLDYPNGPVSEQIHQNTIGVNLSMPLFENNRSNNEAAEKQNMARVSEYQRESVLTDLLRDWSKAQDQLRGLNEKVEIYNNLVKESQERARLIYGSYKVGRLSFLEVQNANLQALDAKVQSAANDVQILFQLAYLASVVEGE